MPDESPANGIKTIWLTQNTETNTMTSRLIALKSRELHTRTRRKLLGTLGGPVVVGIFYGYTVQAFGGLADKLQVPFACALAWSLAGLYFLNRGMWSPVSPRHMGISTGLEFCRQEVERQRDLVRRVLWWSFGPVIWAIGTFIVALAMVSTRERGIFPNGLPFLILIVLWVVAWFAIRYREQRELQREIEELTHLQADGG